MVKAFITLTPEHLITPKTPSNPLEATMTTPPTTVYGVYGQNGENAVIVNNFCSHGQSLGRLRWWSISFWWERRNNARLNDVETRLAAQEAANKAQAEALAGLTQRIDALENRKDLHDAVNAAVDARLREWTSSYGVAVATAMAEVLGAFRPSRFWSRVLGTLGAVGGAVIALAYVMAQRPASWYPLEPGWADTLLLNDNGYAWLFVIFTACLGGWIASRVGHWMDETNDEERRTALLAQAQQAATTRINAGV